MKKRRKSELPPHTLQHPLSTVFRRNRANFGQKTRNLSSKMTTRRCSQSGMERASKNEILLSPSRLERIALTSRDFHNLPRRIPHALPRKLTRGATTKVTVTATIAKPRRKTERTNQPLRKLATGSVGATILVKISAATPAKVGTKIGARKINGMKAFHVANVLTCSMSGADRSNRKNEKALGNRDDFAFITRNRFG